jgi:RimJ/RimL family protein N-acetyltransferase
MRYLGGVQPRSASWRSVMATAGAWALQGFGMFSLIEKSSGLWVGRVGPLHPDGWPGTEVGWGLAREDWGKGYATESAAAAIDWAFDTLGWTEVVHCIDPANAASQNVARRLGSAVLREGRMPAPFDEGPVQIWGQSREAWRERRFAANSRGDTPAPG